MAVESATTARGRWRNAAELLGPIRNYVLLCSNVRAPVYSVNALVIELSVVHAGLVEPH